MAAPEGIVWGPVVGNFGRIGTYCSLSDHSNKAYSIVHMEVWFWSRQAVIDSNNILYFNNNSSSAVTSKGSVGINTPSNSGEWPVANQQLILALDENFKKDQTQQHVNVAAKLVNVDKVGGAMYSNVYYKVPPLPSSTVSYNANGGTGAPGGQTKWYGATLTLSSAVPTRTGHTFLGWSTTAGGGVKYKPGATYGDDQDITLYAVWEAHTYTVSYHANGGTGAPGNQTKIYGSTLVLSGTKPTRENYNFLGWSTSSSGSVSYAPGDSYTTNAGITLYAVWQLAYTAPRITDFSVERCDSSGEPDEEGTYAAVKFSWETDKSVASVKIEHKLSTGDIWTTVTVTGTGTSGKVSKVIGGEFDTEYSYNIRVSVADSVGSSSLQNDIAPLAYDIDILKGGGGVAIGKPANRKGFDVDMPVYFFDRLRFDKDGDGGYIETICENGDKWLTYGSKATGRYHFRRQRGNDYVYPFSVGEKFAYDASNTAITNGLALYTGSGADAIDPNTTLEELVLTDVNVPIGNFMYVRTMFYGSKTANSNRAQYALPYSVNGSMYHRYYFNGSWTSWRRHVNSDEMPQNSVLWDSPAYMFEDQTIWLKERISAQCTGIVIIFSKYESSSSPPYQTAFIPKHQITYANGSAMSFFITTEDANYVGVKTLYVYDDHILGYKYNMFVGTKNGISLKSDKFVLLKVIGV